MKLLVGALAAALLVVPVGAHGDEEHVIELTQHDDDGFYFLKAGSQEKNPTLHLVAGEQYTIKVTNAGNAPHDFNLGALGATRLLDPNESQTITVMAGGSSGAYWCNPHRSAGMEGSFIVDGDSKDSPGLAAGLLLGLLALVAIGRRT